MKIRFHEFTLTSTYKGNKCWQYSSPGFPNYNNHIITIYNRETKKRTQFEYWESNMYKEIKTVTLLKQAFECFLSDALCYMQCKNEWDFFDEFCYEPSRESLRIYKACSVEARKAKRVVGNESRLCDLINEINDVA